MARSAPLPERWHGPFFARRGQSATIEERLGRWIDHAAGGDPEAFERRLALDGLELRSARRMLGEVGLRRGAPLPAWADTLVAVCDSAEQAEPHTHPGVPFGEVLEPFVAHAGRVLAATCNQALSLVRPAAVEALLHGLRLRLATAAGQRILLDFRRYLGSSMELGAPGGSGSAGYRSYVASMLDGGLVGLLDDSAVLARMMATITQAWVGATARFLTDLAEDARALRGRFGDGAALGPVTHVTTTLSSQHHGGRSVVLVTFASGTSLAYKPRDMAVAERFGRLCAWLRQRTPKVDVRGLGVLRRGDHGWMELARPEPCRGRRRAAVYYRRAGSLLGLMGLLGATDMHAANLVAMGDEPYLVDLETLLHPPGPTGSAMDLARTGMLPNAATAVGSGVDMSALGGVADRPMRARVAKWTRLGRDGIRVRYVRATIPPLHNAPVVDGVRLLARDHIEHVQQGFGLVYDALLEHRAALRRSRGPLAGFSGLRVGFMLRPAQLYGTLSERLWHPKFLYDGAERSIEIDRLAAPMLAPSVEPLWPLVRAEHEALERGDIPRFTVSTRGDGIDAGGPVLAPMAATLPQARDRLDAMSEEHRDEQLAVIETALAPERG